MSELFTSRTMRMIGDDAVEALSHKKVAVFGLGGVGSYAVEALARSGIGSLILIDADTVSVSNINRQLIADRTTVGLDKVAVEQERIRKVNPSCHVETHKIFCDGNTDYFFLEGADYVVDAIDTISAKIALILYCRQHNIPILSAMGAGNKIDPTQLTVADLADTSVCPLCRIIRKELRTKGVEHLKVVYSKEEPYQTADGRNENGKTVPGSMIFVPATMGLIIAKEVIFDLIAE